jgi:lysophospholipase L1-like esterase
VVGFRALVVDVRTVVIAGVLLLAVLGACVSNEAEPTQPPDPIRILALGDSYTVGQSVDKLDIWPQQLVRALRVGGRGTAEPTIVAATGWDTDQLSDALNRSDIQGTFDVVTLLIGVNNQFRDGTVEDFSVGLSRLVKSAVQFANGNSGRVILISIPDWGATPFAEGAPRQQIAQSIDEFNDVIWAQAAEVGAHFVDITEISRRAPSEHELIADDGLHPSGVMYAEWVELILPVVQDMIR